MNKLGLVKKIASLLLLLCFVLPLSKCSGKVNPDTHVVAADTYYYGFAIVSGSLHDIRNQISPWESVIILLAAVVVFFLPAACLMLRPQVQAGINFAATFVSGFFLWAWVYALGTPQMGGVLATACWATIFVHSCVLLWRWLCERIRWRVQKRTGGEAG